MPGRSRNGGRWQVNVSLDDVPETIASDGENWDSLPHVTYITATADESKTVDEITYGDKRHGALSLSFAEGVRGAADRDKNGLVLRRELEDYVSYQVLHRAARLLPTRLYLPLTVIQTKMLRKTCLVANLRWLTNPWQFRSLAVWFQKD